jgi:hypothetical protein
MSVEKRPRMVRPHFSWGVSIVRRRALLAVLLSCACTDSGIDAIVIAGQSNAVGWSTWAPTSPSVASVAYTPWDEIVPVRDPISTQWMPGSSPWPTFVDAYAVRHGRTAMLIPTAYGASCLVAERTDGGEPAEPRWDPDGGDLYAKMLEQAIEATAGRPWRVRAVLWDQGECEIGHATQAAYRKALMHLGDRVYEDLGAPLVVRILRKRLDPNVVAIRTAQLEAIVDHPNIIAGPNVDDVEHDAAGVHIIDVVETGKRWAASLDGL